MTRRRARAPVYVPYDFTHEGKDPIESPSQLCCFPLIKNVSVLQILLKKNIKMTVQLIPLQFLARLIIMIIHFTNLDLVQIGILVITTILNFIFSVILLGKLKEILVFYDNNIQENKQKAYSFIQVYLIYTIIQIQLSIPLIILELVVLDGQIEPISWFLAAFEIINSIFTLYMYNYLISWFQNKYAYVDKAAFEAFKIQRLAIQQGQILAALQNLPNFMMQNMMAMNPYQQQIGINQQQQNLTSEQQQQINEMITKMQQQNQQNTNNIDQKENNDQSNQNQQAQNSFW